MAEQRFSICEAPLIIRRYLWDTEHDGATAPISAKETAEEWSEEDKALMETYGKQADFVDFASCGDINEMQRESR